MTNVFDRIASENGRDAEHEIPVSPTREVEQADVANGTPLDVKQVTQELLKFGSIDEATKSELFKRAMTREREVLAALEPLDLSLRLDTHRGVAMLVVAESACNQSDEGEAWTHPLVRRQRLTLEQSLLVAILRQAFVMHEQECGIGQSAAKIAVDDLLPEFRIYFGDSGSDARDESRLLTLLDQLKTHGIVSEVDNNQELTIRPLIVHLANPESLTALLRVLREKVDIAGSSTEESQ